VDGRDIALGVPDSGISPSEYVLKNRLLDALDTARRSCFLVFVGSAICYLFFIFRIVIARRACAPVLSPHLAAASNHDNSIFPILLIAPAALAFFLKAPGCLIAPLSHFFLATAHLRRLFSPSQADSKCLICCWPNQCGQFQVRQTLEQQGIESVIYLFLSLNPRNNCSCCTVHRVEI